MRTLTPRIVGELIQHEGLAREAYRDSVGVWTWSVGITDASGHRVGRYRDNPQPLERCLEVFLWLLATRYLPAVNAAFGAFEPDEHQLGAALSFHYNTGAIARASWLKRFLAGDAEAARRAILDWRRPPEILPRRRKERDLFFDAKWSGDGTVAVFEVSKPRYCPVRPRRMAVAPLIAALAGGTQPDPQPALSRDLDPGPVSDPQPALSRDPDPGPVSDPQPGTWFDRLFD